MPRKASSKRKAAAPPAAKRLKDGNTSTTARSRPTRPAQLPSPSSIDRPRSIYHPADSPSFIDLLPDELLLLVLEHLNAHLDAPPLRPRPFRAMCLTNRRLNRLANNYLYEEFDARPCRHPSKFLRTIVANGDLGGRVRKITWGFRMLDVATKESGEPTSGERRALRESLKRLGVQERAALVEQYCEGDLSQILKLVLLHTPNLRELVVLEETPSTSRNVPRIQYEKTSYLQLLRNAAHGTPIGLSPVYQHLHSLYLRMGDVRLEEMLPIFRLPSLRNLVLDSIDYTPPHVNNALLTALTALSDSSFITNLAITKSFMEKETLVHLIAACKKLTDFTFIYDPRFWVFPIIKISYKDLAKALEKHKKTLENLVLDCESDRHMFTEYERGTLGSLHSFSKLRQFSAPMDAFNLNDPSPDIFEDPGGCVSFTNFADVLPKSLERLALTVFTDEEDTPCCAESLHRWLETIRTEFPNLREIEVKAHKMVCMRRLNMWCEKGHFRELGINLISSQEGIREEDMTDSEVQERFINEMMDVWDEEMMGVWDDEEDFFDYEEFFACAPGDNFHNDEFGDEDAGGPATMNEDV